jgi:hypothetical protein
VDLRVVKPMVSVVVAEGDIEEREKKRELVTEEKKWGIWFSAEFRLEFLPTRVMKYSLIYRGWKRTILSTLEKHISP